MSGEFPPASDAPLERLGRYILAHPGRSAFALGLAFLSLVVGVLLTFFKADQIGDSVPREARKTVSKQLVINCQRDRRFRLLYRDRAIKERKLSRLQLEANDALLDVTVDLQMQGNTTASIVALGERLRSVNAQLRDIRADLQTYPVPRCGDGPRVVPPKPMRESHGGSKQSKPRAGDLPGSTPQVSGSQPTPGPEPGEPSPPPSGDGGDGGDSDCCLPEPPPDPGPTPEPPEPSPPGDPPDPPTRDPGPVESVVDGVAGPVCEKVSLAVVC